MKENFINQLCEKHNFTFIEFLHQNFDKDTSVAKIQNKQTNEFAILKILGTKANEDVKTAFENEVAFYNSGEYSFAPKMLFQENEYLIIDFFEGVPLREHIHENFLQNKIDEEKFSILVKEISLTLDQFFSSGKGIFTGKQTDVEIISDTLYDRIGNLVSSGPEFTQPSNFEQFVIRQFFKLISSKLKINLTKIVNEWISNDKSILSDFGHYDLHSENILVGKNCKIIDYGNFKKPGFWISDLLYFYATFFASLSSKKNLQQKIIEQAFFQISSKEKNLKNNKTLALINLFCLAGDINSRFRIQNKGLKILKILEFVKAVYSL